MVSRRIRFLFSVLTAVVLIIGLCAGDGALSGNGQALPILMYHDVVEDGQPCNTWTVTAGRLREDLQWLKDHGYTSILPRDLEKGPLPKGKSVLITFDDGYESNYRLAFPILKEFGDKAVISLITKYVDEGDAEFLTWDMCREMTESGALFHTDAIQGYLHIPLDVTELGVDAMTVAAHKIGGPVASGARRVRPRTPTTGGSSPTWTPV